MEARYDVIWTDGSSEDTCHDLSQQGAMLMAEMLLDLYPDHTVAVRRVDFGKEKDTGTEA